MHRYTLAENEIAENVASIRQLFEAAPIGISRLGLDGRILEVNRAFGDILGYDPDDLVGMSMQEITLPTTWTPPGR